MLPSRRISPVWRNEWTGTLWIYDIESSISSRVTVCTSAYGGPPTWRADFQKNTWLSILVDNKLKMIQQCSLEARAAKNIMFCMCKSVASRSREIIFPLCSGVLDSGLGPPGQKRCGTNGTSLVKEHDIIKELEYQSHNKRLKELGFFSAWRRECSRCSCQYV